MNRALRRASARGKVKVPMVRLHDLTLDEASLMAEWADAYLLAQERDLPPPEERNPLETWSVERTYQLRELLQAAVEDRPAHDSRGSRLEPSA